MILKKYLPFVLLLLAAIPLFFLNIHNTHSPGGDDYALYIKEAQNIANGRPFYESNYIFNGYNNCYSPPHYPPGFPLLLAPVVKMFGIAIMPMCYFNSVVAVCLLFCFFAYFRKYAVPAAAACLAVIITYSGVMLDLKQSVLSDGTSLLFVMLYLLFRNAETFNWRRITLLILFATMAILIRTQSILLVFAEVIFLVLATIKEWGNSKRLDPKYILSLPSLPVVGGVLLLTVLLNKVVFYSPGSASGFYIEFLKDTLKKGLPAIIRDNINDSINTLKSFFHYETDNSIRTALVTVMESSGLVLCILGFLIAVKRRLCFDDFFFVLVCGLILYYPIHDPRYFLPAIALVFFYCYTALDRIVPAITTLNFNVVGLLLTFLYLFSGYRYIRSTTLPPVGYVPVAKDEQAFSYLKQHVSDSDIILCARPRLITLYTNKKCMIHAWQHNMEENKKVYDSMQVKYLLLASGFVDEYYHTYLNEYQHPLDSTQIAPGYMLYRLR